MCEPNRSPRRRRIVDCRYILGAFARIILSAVFAGIFYVAWLAVALPVFKSGAPSVVRAILWLLAPVTTALGFTAGVVIFEMLPGTRKSKILDILKWPLIGCTIGAGVVFGFGPMLIVFGMFAAGTAGIVLRETIECIRKNKRLTKKNQNK